MYIKETIKSDCVRNKHSVLKKGKRGRKRRGRSLGRYPFLTRTYQYLESYDAFLSETTVAEYRRKLRYFNQIFMELKKESKVNTTDPSKFRQKEISEFLKNMKQRGLTVNTQVKSIQILNGLLRYCNNSVIDQMRAKKLLPERKTNEIQSLSEPEIQHIIRSAKKIEGWNGTVTEFICTIYPYTGLRSGELVKAHRVDLNEHKWTLWVRHPKGGGEVWYTAHSPNPAAYTHECTGISTSPPGKHETTFDSRVRAVNTKDYTERQNPLFFLEPFSKT